MGNACAVGGVPHHVFLTSANRNSLHAAAEHGRIATNTSGMAYYLTVLPTKETPVRSSEYFGSLVVPVPTDARYTFLVSQTDRASIARTDQILAWSSTAVVCAGNEIPASAMVAVRNYAWDHGGERTPGRSTAEVEAEILRRKSQRRFMRVN